MQRDERWGGYTAWDMWFGGTHGIGAWFGAEAVDVGVPWGQDSLRGMFWWDSKFEVLRLLVVGV